MGTVGGLRSLPRCLRCLRCRQHLTPAAPPPPARPARQVDPACDRTFAAEGHDLHSLVFAFLDELLFDFNTSFFAATQLTVTSLDRTAWRITAAARGEVFDRARHESGTEVKAITYSAMQVVEGGGDAEVFVIVDI